ncbi:efflux RND transporter periplasmic adaptor subunit [Sinomicrobium weinanense]|uniref:Efflux RND transporter periplasmic adaptor subunit n=1 Tax=Sinomicrobium weinanense TaxID=2842200 RepID=A0A926Q531_9FLAO|nr:efflux RND transporter periplasmic adaptor subunit [Sinomicrobium weinanense]MBC9797530.1 efflux RND transporter periplasmic adaptor subunit [Sinomicrobium weinanense]MBU3122389.1 efflux RND transporter periplasmic adaptor subunit [Sinomicrobium weinanense]
MKKILMLAGLCALFFHTSCEPRKKEKEAATEFLVTSPLKKDTLITKEYVAQVHSIRHIELRAQERGYLQDIYVDEGQFVKKGQLLFRIMPKLYKAELQKAKAEADFAEIEYKNTKTLTDTDVVAPNELAMAKAKLDKAKAELALSGVHLQFTEIRAPFDGIIDRFHVRQGSYLEEGELLTNMSDNSKMWVYYNVTEAEYLDYMSQTEKDDSTAVNLLMANNRIFEQPGVVETIEADFDNETGNIPFRATFPNPKGLLRHGETGSILMKVPFKDALIIPQKATFEILSKKFVFVVGNDGRVKQKEISVKAELPHLFIVDKGLSVNDNILLEGIRMVKDGEKIAYKVEKPKEVVANLEMYAE